MSKRIRHKFNTIKDEHLAMLAKSFSVDVLQYNQHRFVLSLIIALTDKTVEDLDWHWFSIEAVPIVTTYKFHYLMMFMFYLIDNGEFKDEENVEYILENRYNLENFVFPRAVKPTASRDRYMIDNYPEGYNNVTPFSFVIYTNYKNLGIKKGIVVDGIDSITNNLIVAFLNKKRKQSDEISSTTISIIFENRPGVEAEDFSDETFEVDMQKVFKIIDEDAKRFKTYSLYSYSYTLVAFYLFILDQLDDKTRSKNFKKYTETVLSYQYLVSNLKKGYVVTKHNLYDPVPDEDKWILVKQDNCTDQSPIQCIDFTEIENPVWRSIMKKYYWENITIRYKDNTKKIYAVFDFLNLVSSNHNEITVTPNDLIMFKSELLSKDTCNSRVVTCLGSVRKFLGHSKSEGLIDYSSTIMKYLESIKDDTSQAYTDTYTKEEIEAIINQYKSDYEKCENPIKKQRYLLDYYIILLLSLTEMRIASILRLRTDSLVNTLTSKQKEYALKVPSKTSGGDDDTYNVTNTVAEIFKEVLRVTEEDRKQAPKQFKNVLFICKRDIKRNVATMSDRTTQVHLSHVCEEAGVDYKPISAIRNYYMSEVSDFVSKNNLPESMIPVLSKHGLDVHKTNYVPPDIRELCVLLFHTSVGDFPLSGKIGDQNTLNMVMHNCGSCTQKHCTLKNNYDCLMCENFVTTPDNLSYFEAEIKRVDEAIIAQTNFHEIEFLQLKKQILTTYYAQILNYINNKNMEVII